ncbi:MAG: hypothetical protein II488_05675, partial [Firmicutes bacterium]|nr:hypothetical protein [Bacillota bacterium]
MKKKEGFLGSLLAALPVIIFAAVSILTVRLHYCYRPMTQFGAIGLFDVTQLTDFFAYYKMVVLVAGGILAAVAMLISGVFGLEKRAPEEG